jgi:hypothetical protein
MPTFVDRGVSPLISVFYTGAAIFSFKLLLIYAYEAEWTSFQTQNLAAPGTLCLRPGILTEAVKDTTPDSEMLCFIVI